MDAYLEIARICKERGLEKNLHPETLAQALIYMDTEEHQPTSTPGLTWCGHHRDTSGEDRDSFADGNSPDDSATVRCDTFWIVDGVRITCHGYKYYSYACHANCGGVEDCEIRDECVEIGLWDLEPSDRRLCKNKPDVYKDKLELIELVTRVLCTSRYDSTNQTDTVITCSRDRVLTGILTRYMDEIELWYELPDSDSEPDPGPATCVSSRKATTH